MVQLSEQSIRAEAERIFEARGRPIWSHPLDYWSEAVATLSSGSTSGPPDVSEAGLHVLASSKAVPEVRFPDHDAGRF